MFNWPNLITEDTPSRLQALVDDGTGLRLMFDRREGWVWREPFLFQASYSDGLSVEFQVNPEFGSLEAARAEALFYAEVIGRLPRPFRVEVETSWIHRGDGVFGGGNNNLLIHTGAVAQFYIQAGVLEEVFVHEAVHTSLDAIHAQSPGWIAAQQADPNFISDYARDFPEWEDLAESIVPWLVLRCAADRTAPTDLHIIRTTIPNRIAYLDALELDLEPLGCPAWRVFGDGFE